MLALELETDDLMVALLAEGVDRNYGVFQCLVRVFNVALLAEGVDRNISGQCISSRHLVALLAEGVDRNILADAVTDLFPRRPPRGGRG